MYGGEKSIIIFFWIREKTRFSPCLTTWRRSGMKKKKTFMEVKWKQVGHDALHTRCSIIKLDWILLLPFCFSAGKTRRLYVQDLEREPVIILFKWKRGFCQNLWGEENGWRRKENNFNVFQRTVMPQLQLFRGGKERGDDQKRRRFLL